MIQSSFEGIKVIGVACAVPKESEVLKCKYKDVFGEKNVEMFSKNTGVLERRIAIELQTASDLAFVAAKELLKRKSISENDIGIAIFVTQSPDYKLPSTACVLHKRLGLSKECIAYDINLGCSGFVSGLQTVCSLLSNVNCKYGLLMLGDTINRDISNKDKASAMMFGDAGSAILISKEVDSSIKVACRTDGKGFKSIIVPAGAYRNTGMECVETEWSDGNIRTDYNFYMNGVDVLSFVMSEVPYMLNAFLEQNNYDKETIDQFVLHQANQYIINLISRKCKLPKDKVPITLDRYGNTSGSSIPITLCNVYDNDNSGNDKKIICCGFGVGLSWGVASFSVKDSDILPVIETDDYYNDGVVEH